MLREKYNTLPYPLDEDILAVCKAKETYDKEQTTLNYWALKNAIWTASLTIKGVRSTGELSEDICEKLNEDIWEILCV